MKKLLFLLLLVSILLVPELSYAEELTEESTLNDERTADEWFEFANSQKTASKLLQAFIEAYYHYPSDSRFVEGINTSARSLLDWSTTKHQKGSLEIAEIRYNLILNAPMLNDAIKKETEKKLEYIDSALPMEQDFINQANNNPTASGKLDIYSEGYYVYPNHQELESGVNYSAELLFNWTNNKHQQRIYHTAVDRYQSILDAPVTDPTIKQIAEEYLGYAQKEQLAPAHYIEMAKRSNKVSTILDIYEEGYHLYPNHDAIKQGLQSSTVSLLEWATRQHQNGKTNTAQTRYERILELPLLDSNVKDIILKRLGYALEGRTLPTVENIIHQADQDNTASGKLDIYINGYELYPENQHLITGINESAQLLFNWAKKQHKNQKYEIATDRYQQILNAPKLSKELRVETEKYLKYSSKQELTSEQLYDLANSSTKVSEKFSLFSEGYERFPENTLMKDGLINSTYSLMDWSTIQHQNGKLNTAITRYEMVLASPFLEPTIETEATKKLELANSRSVLPKEEELLKQIEASTKASSKLALAIDSYEFYPRNKDFIVAVNESSTNLLDWATSQHLKGNIDIAIDRYETILDVTVLNNELVTETENKLAYALDGKILPTSKELIEQINNAYKATEKLQLAINSYLFYPRSNEIKAAVESSAISLLEWATIQHLNGNVKTAQERYEIILSAPALPDTLINETSLKLKYANKMEIFPSVSEIMQAANNEGSASKRLEIFNEGYTLHPRDKQIKKGLDQSAVLLMDWAVRKQQSGNFTTSIDRYNKIIESIGVSSSIKQKAKTYRELAKKGKGIYTIAKVVNANVAKYSYSQMEKDIRKLEQQYPYLVTTEVIGKSVEGRNIYAVKLGFGKKEVFLNGSQHAREHMTTNLLMKMLDEYAYSYAKGTKFDSYNTKAILDEVSIWFVPMVNPDGVSLVQFGASTVSNPNEVIRMNNGSTDFKAWKANSRGVDLNRNFPKNWHLVQNDPGRPLPANFKGYKPLSEPEAIALYEFTKAHNFKTEVDYHSSGSILYFGDDLYGINNSLHKLSKKIAEKVSLKTGYSLYYTRGIPGGGRRADWSQQDLGRPVLTPEIAPYVGNRPVPLSYFNSIWNKNNSIGLLIAEEASHR
ncbi:M14 family zinc carboxypeptidase [Ornithinibacillus halophilus]|uniref:Mannosyl-glycoprotein endo-beta-N-acetylglucosaminidase n=1 Tax=Ornithinibacillus halophilus TaxID=930117 RepID=A0A1M5E938_9BACI|nr:M14 family zinc carboxypeptidase [Ornithinibacillus halophilus]SHF75561.1 mannosyl-glycoprotein endo-beta-N-acetylglucosaminidase [Ornithinibacillus halophilus]